MNTSSPTRDLNDPDELQRFLTAYRPSDVADSIWLVVATDVVALVTRAGALTRLRVEKDIQCVGHVVAHLVDRGRPVSMQEVLDDRTLLSYDVLLQRSSPGTRTRENQRGILRRLQAVHRDLPWRQARRADGERVQNLVPLALLADLRHAIDAAAGAAAKGGPASDAQAFLDTIARARADRDPCADAPLTEAGVEPGSLEVWQAARRFAADRGLSLTKRVLRALVTHEVLMSPDPIALMVPRLGLTRADLDLALTHRGDPELSAAEVELLRGPQQY